jgi:hypothetical protein
MSVYSKTIAKLQLEQSLVDLYRDHLDDESITGVITKNTHEYAYMSLFRDDGLENGISIVRSSDITRIRWGGNVRDSIQCLINQKKSKALKPEINLKSIRAIIESVHELYGYVNILTEEMDSGITFIGEVKDIDDDHLVLYGYGTMTTRDTNHIIIALNEITRVDAEAQYEKDIAYLSRKGS